MVWGSSQGNFFQREASKKQLCNVTFGSRTAQRVNFVKLLSKDGRLKESTLGHHVPKLDAMRTQLCNVTFESWTPQGINFVTLLARGHGARRGTFTGYQQMLKAHGFGNVY